MGAFIVPLTVRAQRVDEKNGIICLVFMSPSWVIVLKLSKIVSFLQIFADVSKKLSLLQQILIMHLKVLVSLF